MLNDKTIVSHPFIDRLFILLAAVQLGLWLSEVCRPDGQLWPPRNASCSFTKWGEILFSRGSLLLVPSGMTVHPSRTSLKVNKLGTRYHWLGSIREKRDDLDS